MNLEYKKKYLKYKTKYFNLKLELEGGRPKHADRVAWRDHPMTKHGTRGQEEERIIEEIRRYLRHEFYDGYDEKFKNQWVPIIKDTGWRAIEMFTKYIKYTDDQGESASRQKYEIKLIFSDELTKLFIDFNKPEYEYDVITEEMREVFRDCYEMFINVNLRLDRLPANFGPTYNLIRIFARFSEKHNESTEEFWSAIIGSNVYPRRTQIMDIQRIMDEYGDGIAKDDKINFYEGYFDWNTLLKTFPPTKELVNNILKDTDVRKALWKALKNYNCWKLDFPFHPHTLIPPKKKCTPKSGEGQLGGTPDSNKIMNDYRDLIKKYGNEISFFENEAFLKRNKKLWPFYFTPVKIQQLGKHGEKYYLETFGKRDPYNDPLELKEDRVPLENYNPLFRLNRSVQNVLFFNWDIINKGEGVGFAGKEYIDEFRSNPSNILIFSSRLQLQAEWFDRSVRKKPQPTGSYDPNIRKERLLKDEFTEIKRVYRVGAGRHGKAWNKILKKRSYKLQNTNMKWHNQQLAYLEELEQKLVEKNEEIKIAQRNNVERYPDNADFEKLRSLCFRINILYAICLDMCVTYSRGKLDWLNSEVMYLNVSLYDIKVKVKKKDTFFFKSTKEEGYLNLRNHDERTLWVAAKFVQKVMDYENNECSLKGVQEFIPKMIKAIEHFDFQLTKILGKNDREKATDAIIIHKCNL
jgi:hypothetical protein